MPCRVKIVAMLTARSGQAADLRALLADRARRFRAEPGNLRWDVWQDKDRPDRYLIDQLYIDDEAVAAHLASPHYRVFLSKLSDLADHSAVVCDPIAM